MDWKQLIFEKTIIIAVSLIASFFIILGILTGAMIILNIGVAAVVIFSVLYFTVKYLQFRTIREYEEQFPNFLRDLSQSLYAGLGLIEAIKSTAKSDYGKLNQEIEKINNQLSWNIPLEKVLDGFSKRASQSRQIQRSIAIVKQAQKSGGDMDDILNSLADNMEKIKDVEEERKTMMGQHVTMMYTIFFIFVAISISLIKFLIPMLEDTNRETNLGLGLGGGGSSPCSACEEGGGGGACDLCGLFFHVSESFGMSEDTSGASYYKGLFFLMIVIEGIFSGLVAGQISSNSVIAGARHSIIMGTSGFFIFLIVNWIGLI